MDFRSFVRQVGGASTDPLVGSDPVPDGLASKSSTCCFSFKLSGKSGVGTIERLAVTYQGPAASLPTTVYVFDERSETWTVTGTGLATPGGIARIDLLSPLDDSSSIDVYVQVSDPGGLAAGIYRFLISGDSSSSVNIATTGGPAANVAVTNFPATVQTNVLSSALPTGAATAARQDTGNASLAAMNVELASIDGKTPVLGQALAGGSSPAVLPAAQEVALRDVSDRAGRDLGHVTVDASALPAGAATSAIQATSDASLASIDGKVSTSALQVTGNASLSSIDTKVSTSALQTSGNASLASVDTKVSTSALQTTGNASLASIDTKTPALGQALAAASSPAVLPAAQETSLRDVSDRAGRALGQVTVSSTADAPVFTEACFSPRHLGPFGDLIAQPLWPLLQLDFVYGIFSQLGTTTVSGAGASADTNAGRLRLQCGTSNGGVASFTSTRQIRYRPGQGVDARFTAVFTAGVASSEQIVGVGNIVSGTLTDGYFFGFNGVTFSIRQVNSGASTWIAQSSWNVDTCDGSAGASNPSGFNLNPTFGNVYSVRYPYMGFGNIFFYVETAEGRVILVHVIQYVSTSSSIQLSNPTLTFFARSLSLGSTTNLTVLVGATGVFLVGQRRFTGAQFGIDNTKAAITTETSILALRNATTFNGVVNRAALRLRSLSFASDAGNNTAVLRVKAGVTLGGAPVFTPISGVTGDNGVTITSGQSPASFDVAGTTVTGGTTLYNSTAARNTGFEIDLTEYDIYVLPGETYVFSMACGSSATSAVTINWQEDK